MSQEWTREDLESLLAAHKREVLNEIEVQIPVDVTKRENRFWGLWVPLVVAASIFLGFFGYFTAQFVQSQNLPVWNIQLQSMDSFQFPSILVCAACTKTPTFNPSLISNCTQTLNFTVLCDYFDASNDIVPFFDCSQKDPQFLRIDLSSVEICTVVNLDPPKLPITSAISTSFIISVFLDRPSSVGLIVVSMEGSQSSRREYFERFLSVSQNITNPLQIGIAFEKISSRTGLDVIAVPATTESTQLSLARISGLTSYQYIDPSQNFVDYTMNFGGTIPMSDPIADMIFSHMAPYRSYIQITLGTILRNVYQEHVSISFSQYVANLISIGGGCSAIFSVLLLISRYYLARRLSSAKKHEHEVQLSLIPWTRKGRDIPSPFHPLHG